MTIGSGGKRAENRANQRDELRQRSPSIEKAFFSRPRNVIRSAPHPPLWGWESSSYTPSKIFGQKRVQQLLSGAEWGVTENICANDKFMIARQPSERCMLWRWKHAQPCAATPAANLGTTSAHQSIPPMEPNLWSLVLTAFISMVAEAQPAFINDGLIAFCQHRSQTRGKLPV